MTSNHGHRKGPPAQSIHLVDPPRAMSPHWQNVRNLLAVRLDNLGDVLLATPALHAIKESLPDVKLTLLTSPVGAQAASLNPDLDDVIEYQAPWMDPWQRLPQDVERELDVLDRVREREFDAAVIFTSFRQSSLPAAYLCYLAGIPLRLAASIDGPGSLLTTRHKHPDVMMHEVPRGLDLVGAVGMKTSDDRLVLRVPEGEAYAAGRLIEAMRADGPVIALHAGCSMPARTYPWESYADTAELLSGELNACVLLTGDESERELTARIKARSRGNLVDLGGRLSFSELCAVIQAADLTLTNNTGPMHISAAVGTPVVVLFALTNPPEQWGPWRVPHRLLTHDVPCRICYQRVCPIRHECLTMIEPREILDSVRELWAETQGRQRTETRIGVRTQGAGADVLAAAGYGAER